MRNEYNGNLLYDKANLKSFTVEDFARYRKDHISIVFQDLRLFPEQTVRENLELKRQLNPFHPPEKITEMAERLGIGSKLSTKSRICSYGEQQRVAIIRSLLQPFDFLLLDEPFSHLDDNNSKKAMELMLEEAKARNAGILFADLERIDFFPGQGCIIYKQTVKILSCGIILPTRKAAVTNRHQRLFPLVFLCRIGHRCITAALFYPDVY